MRFAIMGRGSDCCGIGPQENQAEHFARLFPASVDHAGRQAGSSDPISAGYESRTFTLAT